MKECITSLDRKTDWVYLEARYQIGNTKQSADTHKLGASFASVNPR